MPNPLRLPLPYYDDLAVRYVAPYGNDQNDGFDFRYPKETILAAVDTLPDGGTINIMDGSYVGGEVPGQGIWLTNNATLYPGWRAAKPYRFVGFGGAQHTAGALILKGQPGVESTLPHRRQSTIWITRSTNHIEFENLVLAGAWGVHIRLAVDGDPELDPDDPEARGSIETTTDVTFRNVTTVFDLGEFGEDQGPSVDVGYVIWAQFFDSLLTGNPGLALDHDRRAGVLVKPADGTSFLRFYQCRGGGGGIKYYCGASTFGIIVDDYMVEGDFINPLPPAVQLLNLINSGFAYLNNVSNQDAGSGQELNVLITGVSSPEQVVCVGTASIQGSATTLGGSPSWNSVVDPNGAGQVGFINTKLYGDTDAARRLGLPVTSRFRNLLPVHNGSDGITGDVTPMTSLFKTSNCTLTEVVPDIIGGTGAFRIATTDTSSAVLELFGKNISVSPGDRFAFGFWARCPDGFAGSNLGDIQIPSGTPHSISVGRSIPRTFRGDGEWQWHSVGLTITEEDLDDTTTANVRFLVQTGLTGEVEFCLPVAYHFGDGVVSENEFSALVRHMAPHSQAPEGSVATQVGQKFIAHAGLGVGNAVDAVTLGSVVKNIEIFDENGASLGFVEVKAPI